MTIIFSLILSTAHLNDVAFTVKLNFKNYVITNYINLINCNGQKRNKKQFYIYYSILKAITQKCNMNKINKKDKETKYKNIMIFKVRMGMLFSLMILVLCYNGTFYFLQYSVFRKIFLFSLFQRILILKKQ